MHTEDSGFAGLSLDAHQGAISRRHCVGTSPAKLHSVSQFVKIIYSCWNKRQSRRSEATCRRYADCRPSRRVAAKRRFSNAHAGDGTSSLWGRFSTRDASAVGNRWTNRELVSLVEEVVTSKTSSLHAGISSLVMSHHVEVFRAISLRNHQ